MANWHDSTEWKTARTNAKKYLTPVCVTCNKDLEGNDWTIDHIIASNPPNHDLTNLQSMCRECNGRKQDRKQTRIAFISHKWR